MAFGRIVCAAMTGWLLVTGAWSHAQAQQPVSGGMQPADASGWSFNIAPYLWLPTVNANLSYDLPPALGGRLPTDVSSGPGDYISKLHFATAFAADARYGQFSILTDYMYTYGATGSTNIKSLDLFGLPSQPISRMLQVTTSTTLKTTLWTLAGGYTVVQGDWGNFDVLAGVRFLGMNAGTDYDLALTVVGPRGNGTTFGGGGSISGSTNVWNGIAGFRGRIRLPVDGLFVPYYFDIGAGGSKLTWQISSGLGYQTGWAGVSLLYRYLSFEQGSSAIVRHLGMGGPMLMVNFSF
jgi:hypothetical protein